MDAETMTPQQLRELADRKDRSVTRKIGYLKEDLFRLIGDTHFQSSSMHAHLYKERAKRGWDLTLMEADEMIREYTLCLLPRKQQVFEAGRQFFGYKRENGEWEWLDKEIDEHTDPDMCDAVVKSQGWALSHLRDIQDVENQKTSS